MMSRDEICREYRTAKCPSKQIQVLADLNGTDRKTILKILVENGEQVDGRLLRGLKTEAQGAGTSSAAAALARNDGSAGKTGGDGLPRASAPTGDGGDPSAAEGGHTHTHTAGGTPEEPRPDYITLRELIELLRDYPGECRVQIGERYLAGFAYIHGVNAVSREEMHVMQLIGAEEDV